MTKKVAKKVVKKRGGRKMSEPEKIVRAIQGVAGAAVVAYRIIKPHLKKRKTKKTKKKPERLVN